jgi:hypothetical protein
MIKMTNKPYYNLCRNRHIIEQMTGSPGKRELGGQVGPDANMLAAQFADTASQKKINDLLDQHTGAAHEDGIKKHGHWDLTKKDSDSVTEPHFINYMHSVKSIDPVANESKHRKIFDAQMNDRAMKLHIQGTEKAQGLLSRLAGAVTGGIKRMVGMGEGVDAIRIHEQIKKIAKKRRIRGY